MDRMEIYKKAMVRYSLKLYLSMFVKVNIGTQTDALSAVKVHFKSAETALSEEKSARKHVIKKKGIEK